MGLFLSPWFIGLSVGSILVTFLHLWGFYRACRKHNVSTMVLLCGKRARQPNGRTIIVAVLYVTLTIAYVLLPLLLHPFFPTP